MLVFLIKLLEILRFDAIFINLLKRKQSSKNKQVQAFSVERNK